MDPGRQFKFDYSPPDETQPEHMVMATTHAGGAFVGMISWHRRTGRVGGIGVVAEHRRKGVATHLWDEAHRAASERGVRAPVHSEEQTEDGHAWAKKVDE